MWGCSLLQPHCFLFFGSRVRRTRGVRMCAGIGEKMKPFWNMVFVQAGLVLLWFTGPCVAQVSKNATIPTPQPAQKKQAVATKQPVPKKRKAQKNFVSCTTTAQRFNEGCLLVTSIMMATSMLLQVPSAIWARNLSSILCGDCCRFEMTTWKITESILSMSTKTVGLMLCRVIHAAGTLLV